MTADREPNRLPLRAGAMVLLAVAVVFVALGWNSAASSDDDPAADLEAAEAQASQNAPQPSPEPTPSQANDIPVCVFNAGSVAGLAQEVSDDLDDAGFDTQEPGNISGGGFTENTVMYSGSEQQPQAERVGETLGANTAVEARPSNITDCPNGILVVVVTRS